MTSTELAAARLPHQRSGPFTALPQEQEDALGHLGVQVRVGEASDGWEWDRAERSRIRAVEMACQEQVAAEPGQVWSFEDPRSQWFHGVPGVQRWRALWPSARALYCLQRPDAVDSPVELDEEAKAIFRHGHDAMGVRNRASVMRQGVVQAMAARPDLDRVRWVSLACGAALPVLDAAEALRRETGKSSDLTLVDLDPDALVFAGSLASPAGVAHQTLHRDLVRGMVATAQPLVDELGQGRADVVDLLGIFEYFKDSPAKKILAAASRLVAPGGLLVLGNIRTDDPTWDFTQRVARWPTMVPRSLLDLATLITGIGIDPARLSIEVTPEGVYAVAFLRF